MRKNLSFAAIILSGALMIGAASCSKNNDSLPVQEEITGGEHVDAKQLLGNWTPKEYKDETTVYEKTANLKANQYGYMLKAGGKLTARSNAGWCGTPPIITNDYEGTWTLEHNILTINGLYWGGKVIEKWEVMAVSATSLSLKIISTEFPK
ncbi:hypothetical protein [Niabella aquatica]